MEYKKTHSCQNTASTAVSYPYSSGIQVLTNYYHGADCYTVIVIVIIMLLWPFYLTVTTDLINFIIVTCKIWWKISLAHETSMAETETLAF